MAGMLDSRMEQMLESVERRRRAVRLLSEPATAATAASQLAEVVAAALVAVCRPRRRCPA